MEIIGKPIKDKRINSSNYILEVTLKEYYDLTSNVLNNNEYQRGRVKSSSTVYSLLKDDLKKGCLMPPIVMALSMNIDKELPNEDIINIINKSKDSLIIIDGLQRSYTIRDLIISLAEDKESIDVFNNKIRVEIYIGINKLGILYRMLTLNTGQTAMSTRHQIEIIYSDYIINPIKNIKFIREIDEDKPKNPGEFKFRDIIEGFTSFIERDYLTLERIEILDNIKGLENLSTIDQSNQLFEDFVATYNNFIFQIINLSNNWSVDDENLKGFKAKPFGRDVISIFNKSQSLTGFGSAIGKLIDFKSINNLSEINQCINDISNKTINDGLTQILVYLEKIRPLSKKIGNDQRLFFHFLFRELFDKEGESFSDLLNAANAAYKQYERKTM